MKIIKKNAYAKINLGLQVINKRKDGFHNINTVFYKTKLYDELIFKPLVSNEIIINSDYNIPLEDNLIYKTIKKIQNRTKKEFGAEINLYKKIPVGAGLGGGSSNSASTILAIDELFDLNLSYSEKMIIAQSLGSDIPFFLNGKTAIGQGRGEKLEYFDFQINDYLYIINPNIHIDTKVSYNSLNRDSKPRNKINFKMILGKSKHNNSLLNEFIINDFEKTIFEKYPEILTLKNQLYNLGANFALMSGSGSSVFAIFEEDVFTLLKESFSNYSVFEA